MARPFCSVPGNSFDFEGLRSRQGQAGAVLVAYDLLEADGADRRAEPLGSAGSVWRGCYAARASRCAMASN
jgi:hypothetical protein